MKQHNVDIGKELRKQRIQGMPRETASSTRNVTDQAMLVEYTSCKTEKKNWNKKQQSQ